MNIPQEKIMAVIGELYLQNRILESTVSDLQKSNEALSKQLKDKVEKDIAK